MNTNAFLKLAKQATKTVSNYKYRPKDQNNKPGGLLEIPGKIKPIIIGDLHGCVENLKDILNHKNNLQEIKSNKKILIIVGDAVHNDQTGKMLEMDSSLETLTYLFEILVKYPSKILYIRGNHDTFDERLRKSGISQGLEFKKHLLKTYNEAVVDEVKNFFDSLPLFIIGDGYVITHAGPVRRGTTREELINIAEDKNKYMQLMWTRIHEFRGNPSLKEYDSEDIIKTLEKLKMPKESTHFIVGHNPLWNSGDKTGIWLNVLGVKNHHIIYTNFQTLAPYLTIEGNEVKKNFAREKKEEDYYGQYSR